MINAFNNCHLIGRIPTSDKIKYEYTEATNEAGTNSRMSGFLSVKASMKKKDDQYYQESLIPFVAFGNEANFMHQYIARGTTVAMICEFQVNRKEDEEGNAKIYYSMLVNQVRTISSPGNGNPEEAVNSDKKENPFQKKKSNPFKK